MRGPEEAVMAETCVLEVKGVHAGYGAIKVLKGVDLAVGEGEIVILIGANGAGKTTLLRTISGILRRRQGDILFRGEQIADLPPHEIVHKGLIHIQEGRGIFTKMTVLENLKMGAYARKDRQISRSLQRVFELFPVLKERQRQLGGTLSGGEQQMLALGRALMAEPQLLLLDEPSLGLAPMLVNEMFRMIRSINETGVSILLVEQNARKALQFGHRGYCLENGRITLKGDCNDLLNNPEVKRAYLGRAPGLAKAGGREVR